MIKLSGTFCVTPQEFSVENFLSHTIKVSGSKSQVVDFGNCVNSWFPSD